MFLAPAVPYIAAAFTVGSAVYTADQSRKAAKAQANYQNQMLAEQRAANQQVNAIQQEIGKGQKEMQSSEAVRAIRLQARDARVQRARLLNAAMADGQEGATGVLSVEGSIQGNFGANVGSIQDRLARLNRESGLEQSIFDIQAQSANTSSIFQSRINSSNARASSNMAIAEAIGQMGRVGMSFD